MLDMILKVFPLVVSFIALIVSIAVAWSNRKSLHVEIRKELEVVQGGSIFFINNDDTVDPYGDCLLTTIEVVNPSPKDIAFFDLRAFYPETNMNIHLLTKRTMMNKYRSNILWRAVDSPDGEMNLQELLTPDTNYGIFKANSFTRFHIVMFPDTNANELLLSFKVAMKARIKDEFAVTGRKKFKPYGVAFDINSWSESLQQSEQKVT